jgi:predicted GNAT family acetyltransferase
MLEELRHQPDRRRFVMETPSGEAFVEYRRLPRVADRAADGDHEALDLYYSYVPRPERGGGVGRRLVLQVLDHAREHGLTVVPSCHFVATVIREHPAYHDLVTPRREETS